MDLAAYPLGSQRAGGAYAGAVAENQAERNHHRLIVDMMNAIEQKVTESQMAIWL